MFSRLLYPNNTAHADDSLVLFRSLYHFSICHSIFLFSFHLSSFDQKVERKNCHICSRLKSWALIFYLWRKIGASHFLFNGLWWIDWLNNFCSCPNLPSKLSTGNFLKLLSRNRCSKIASHISHFLSTITLNSMQSFVEAPTSKNHAHSTGRNTSLSFHYLHILSE